MAEVYRDRIQEIEQEINNLKEVLAYATSDAVYIKDPKKRRKCPVCHCNLYLYYINFEEMFLMCENSNCEFPLGYEALQIVRHENELRENPVKATPDFFEYPNVGGNDPPINIDNIKSVSTTMSSFSAYSDCDRLSQVDPEDLAINKQEILTTRLTRLGVERRIQQKKTKEVKTNLHRIKELTEEMHMLDSKTHVNMIKNKKWLQNLKAFESETGHKLLTDLENKELVKTNPTAPVKELKISVDQTNGDSERPGINIHIQFN